MLIGYPTKFGTGIEIYGDYYDLRSLHEVLHTIHRDVGEASFVSDLCMGLAYEVRKANGGHRQKKKIRPDDKTFYYGFQYSWPDILITLNVLRQSVGYLGNYHEINANLFRLEHITIEALKQYDEVTAIKLVKWITEHKILLYSGVNQILDEIRMRHYTEKNGKTRFKKLNQHIELILHYTKEHLELMQHYEERAKRLNCNIENLEIPLQMWNDVEFKW